MEPEQTMAKRIWETDVKLSWERKTDRMTDDASEDEDCDDSFQCVYQANCYFLTASELRCTE